LSLRDAPRFEHRGLLLDVARNFHPKATVLRLLDLMGRLKLNKLHLHLTDDEGWRLAIPGLPELTEFGARRGHSADPWRHLPPAYGSGPDVANPDGSGHYSAADYAQILRFAAARHIEVIPEIEMPGHARAAVKAMQARARRLTAAAAPDATRYLLDDPADRSRYRSAQLYSDNVMDPGLPSTYAFIEHVVQALVVMHRQAGVPLRQLHVGADETPAGAWSGSPASMALVERQRLAGLPGLWNHFYDRVGEILARHGLAAGGWEELGARREKPDGSGPLVPNEHFAGRGHTLYVWNNLDEADDLAYRLANAGYRVVLAPATTLYLDMAHTATPGELGVNWAAYADLHQVFDYVPLDALGRTPLPATVAAGKAALSEVRPAPGGRHRSHAFQRNPARPRAPGIRAAAAPAGAGRTRLGGQPGLGHRSRSCHRRGPPAPAGLVALCRPDRPPGHACAAAGHARPEPAHSAARPAQGFGRRAGQHGLARPASSLHAGRQRARPTKPARPGPHHRARADPRRCLRQPRPPRCFFAAGQPMSRSPFCFSQRPGSPRPPLLTHQPLTTRQETMTQTDIRNQSSRLGRHAPPASGRLLITPVAAAALLALGSGLVQAQSSAGVTDTVVVTGIRKSIETSVTTKRESDSIVEAISAEDLGKLPDTSIAESLARLPGLTAQRVEGRDQVISIRGLAPKFGVTLLNGREMVSTGDNRSVEYDQFPSELMNAATVYKTPDAALGAQGLAGTVNLLTVRPLDTRGRQANINVRLEKNSNGGLVTGGTGGKGKRLSLSYVDQFADNTIGVALGYAHLDSPNQQKYFKSWWWGNTAVWGGGFPGLDDKTSSCRALTPA
jgi:hypothetical protein